jgi:hypothetical protein
VAMYFARNLSAWAPREPIKLHEAFASWYSFLGALAGLTVYRPLTSSTPPLDKTSSSKGSAACNLPFPNPR